MGAGGDAARAVYSELRNDLDFVTAIVNCSSLGGLVGVAVGLIGSNKLADGERALAAADKKWPNAPGLEAMRCDLLFRQTNVDGARAACNRALATDPGAVASQLSAALGRRRPRQR